MKKSSIITLCLSVVFFSCNQSTSEDAVVQHQGAAGIRSYSLKGFKDIEVSSALQVVLTQGTTYSVKVDADEAFLNKLQLNVSGAELKIGLKGTLHLKNNHRAKVYITAPEFRKLEASGACSFSNTQLIQSAQPIKLELSGVSHAVLHLEAPRIEVEHSGSGSVTLKGKTTDLELEGSGVSTFNCFEMIADNVAVDLSGAGNAFVWATKALRGDISGVSTIHYKGNPAVLHQERSGMATFKKVD